MKTACLLLLISAALFGASKSAKNSVEETLIQLEQEWSQADTNKDAAALDRILANDYMGIDFEGRVVNKAQALKGVTAETTSLESTVLRNMKVRIYGATAIITGTDTQRGEYHGEDSSGRYVWTDIFVRRNGRWQAVSSQSTRLVNPTGPKQVAGLR